MAPDLESWVSERIRGSEFWAPVALVWGPACFDLISQSTKNEIWTVVRAYQYL